MQHRQINLILLKLETMHEFTIKYFDDYKSVYNHIIDIVSKYEDAKHFKQDVKLIVNNIDQDAYIQSSVILLNSFSKTKKAKTIADSEKSVFKSYKQKICSALSRHLINPKPENLEAYAIVVKHIINSDNQEDTTKMLEFLETYVDMAVSFYRLYNYNIIVLYYIVYFSYWTLLAPDFLQRYYKTETR